MNQDNNNNFELSGTLGSLNDAALDNLTTQHSNDVEINNGINQSEEIEMLDAVVEKEASTNQNNVEEVNQPNVTLDSNENNTFNTEETFLQQPVLNPIQNNFDIGDIGSVPPVDPTGKDKKKPKKKNVLFIILLIIIILAVGGLVYYYLHISKGSIGNAVETKNITLELGEELPTDINEYASFKSVSSNNCVLNTESVDISNAGEYEYTITCGNNIYKGNITLKDTKAPDVLAKTIVKKVNDTVTADEFIGECKESSECVSEFENSELVLNNLKQAGTYDINIIVKDANENSSTIPVKLIVIESDIKVYLNCTIENQTVENFNGTVSYVDKIGISPESTYAGLYFKITKYIVSSEEEYQKIKTNYRNNGVLDINNGIGVPIFDDESLTITIEETLSGEAGFGSDYSSIKSYYETTKNYKCNILNVN